ncbi:unnamed protein product [Mytilus edulis]|uniref:Ig-like domain-containing protein n=1 Tax=Mytilus edulis TaxID=6550 RepID=A0A8S3QZC7_MYTED|nr:unnamed protein product [Mytilus edulis]
MFNAQLLQYECKPDEIRVLAKRTKTKEQKNATKLKRLRSSNRIETEMGLLPLLLLFITTEKVYGRLRCWKEDEHNYENDPCCQEEPNNRTVHLNGFVLNDMMCHCGTILIILINVLILRSEAGVVTVVPYEAVCNTSESVELTCVNNDKHLQTEWTAKWIHQLNRIFIRSPSSEVNGNISTMTIKFCDYKDTGTYICEWTSGEKVYKSSAKVTVHVESRLDYAYGTVGAFLGLTIIVVFIVVVYRAQLMKRVSQDNLQHISIYEDIQSIQSQVYRDDTENENERVDTSRSGSDTSSERPYLELEPPNTYEDLEKSDRVEMQTYSQ